MTRSRGLLLGVSILVFSLLAGCPKVPERTESDRNPLKPRPEDTMPQSDVRRGTQKRLVESMMHNIGQLYSTYLTDFNQPPATLQDFMNYIKRDATNEYRAIEAGTIIFLPKVQPGSHNVLAYEKDKYEKWNNRVVVFADGHVETMDDNEFQKLTKK